MAVKRKRILAVDDDPAALAVVKQILAQRGYDVITAASGEDALEILGRDTPDLMLLDVSMPGISGFDLCRQVRQDARTKDTPVIFLSAKGMLPDMVEGKSAGSDLYLVKPVLATKLVNMVGMFLSTEAPLAKKPRRVSS